MTIDSILNFSHGEIEAEHDVYEEQTYHNINQICDRLAKESEILIIGLDEAALRKFAGQENAD